MQYILSSFWIGLELLCCLTFVSAFHPRRYSKIVCNMSFVIAWLLMSYYSNTDINEVVKQVVTLIFLSALSVFLYEGKLISHIFWVVLCYIFIILIDTAFAYGISAVMNITFSEFVWLKLTYICVTTTSKLLSLFLAWLFKRYRSAGGIHGVQTKWFLLLLLFPTASVVMLVIVFFGNQGNQDMSIGAVIISGIIASANWALIYIVSAIEKGTRIESEAKLLKQQISFQTDNYIALQHSYKLQRKATHEFEHHIQTLRELMHRNDVNTAIDYLDKLYRNRTLRIFSVNSNHPVIDVILNQKHQLAIDSGIKMQVQVNDLSKIAISSDSLVVLLSNILDNAIEACQRLDSRKEINCSIYQNELLYIAVRNTSLPVESNNGIFLTSKSNDSEHGYGIPAICYILDQLKAEYTFDYKDGWFQFVAEIP